MGESTCEADSLMARNDGRLVVSLSGPSTIFPSVGVSESGGRSLAGDGARELAAEAATAAAAVAKVAASASTLIRATTSSSLLLLSAAACLASFAWVSRIDLLYASLMVSRRCAKSIGPTEILRRRVAAADSSDLGAPRWLLGGWDEDPPSGPLILDAVVVAVATDCLGRELRKLGDSLGVGAET